MAQKNRWHPVMLPDDYLRKLKQDLAESDAIADPSPRLEPDPGALVGRAMRTEFTTATAGQTLEQVYTAIQACRCSSLPVLDSGRIVGLVTLEALGRYLVFAGAGSGANRA
jgi:CBS domain-containing protein